MADFTNTSSVAPSVPTGIPDPRNPGYDTAGYLLGATDKNGIISIPNPGTKPGTGYTALVNQDPVSSAGGFAQFTPTPAAQKDTGGGSADQTADWAAIARSMFGSMPSVGQYTPPPFSYDQFSAPDPFSAPNGQDVLNADPGFEFRVGQGTGAMQNSAAARGVLNTGGTLQDLVDYGQNAASQEYGNAYNRALGTYQTNFNDKLQGYLTNFGNALTRYNTNYGTQYQTPYNELMQQYGQGVANQAQIFGQRFNTATA